MHSPLVSLNKHCCQLRVSQIRVNKHLALLAQYFSPTQETSETGPKQFHTDYVVLQRLVSDWLSLVRENFKTEQQPSYVIKMEFFSSNLGYILRVKEEFERTKKGVCSNDDLHYQLHKPASLQFTHLSCAGLVASCSLF